MIPNTQIKGTLLLMPNGNDVITTAPSQPVTTDKSAALDAELAALLKTSLKVGQSVVGRCMGRGESVVGRCIAAQDQPQGGGCAWEAGRALWGTALAEGRVLWESAVAGGRALWGTALSVGQHQNPAPHHPAPPITLPSPSGEQEEEEVKERRRRCAGCRVNLPALQCINGGIGSCARRPMQRLQPGGRSAAAVCALQHTMQQQQACGTRRRLNEAVAGGG